MARNQKLELTWIGKENRPQLEPRILLEEPARSYHAGQRVSDKDLFDNRLIFGDNLLALKALEQEFAGKVKCVFIDPPYNTGSAFTHYDDGVEHSIWLGLMRDRLEIIRRLLADDGSLWITIDDNEAHYLKVLCDEVFGRGSFVTSFIWKKVDSPNDNKVSITPDHEYILCVTRTPDLRPFKQKTDQSILDAYRPPDAESIRSLGSQPAAAPTSAHLKQPEVQARIVAAVQAQQPKQMELDATTAQPDIAAIVAKTVELVTQKTIDIPRILVVPRGEVKSGFKPFELDLSSLRYPPVDEELWVQTLRTRELEVLALGRGGMEEARVEDYVVSGLVDFDDVSYDEHADLLYDLAAQTVRHFQSYLSEEDTRKVLRCYQRPIAKLIHTQMQAHHWEEADAGYEVKVSQGYSELKPSAYICAINEPLADYRVAPADKSNMARLLFGGFERCLYGVQKFDSDAERKLAVILDREALRWFKPAKGQFQIFYKNGADPAEYVPDFVAETADGILMLEPKARNEIDDPTVVAKKEAAVKWCENASSHTDTHGGKPWYYCLIPHDEIAENITLDALLRRWGIDQPLP